MAGCYLAIYHHFTEFYCTFFITHLFQPVCSSFVLKQYIDEVRLNYDFILIDCAPSLSVLTVNALVAADSVLIPTQPQYFSMAGIQMFYDTFSKIRKKMNPSLSIEGVLVTMMDNRPNFTKELVTQLRNAYGDVFRVFQTEIPTSIRMSDILIGIFELQKSPIHGLKKPRI